jgi:hypothetical protein
MIDKVAIKHDISRLFWEVDDDWMMKIADFDD